MDAMKYDKKLFLICILTAIGAMITPAPAAQATGIDWINASVTVSQGGTYEAQPWCTYIGDIEFYQLDGKTTDPTQTTSACVSHGQKYDFACFRLPYAGHQCGFKKRSETAYRIIVYAGQWYNFSFSETTDALTYSTSGAHGFALNTIYDLDTGLVPERADDGATAVRYVTNDAVAKHWLWEGTYQPEVMYYFQAYNHGNVIVVYAPAFGFVKIDLLTQRTITLISRGSPVLDSSGINTVLSISPDGAYAFVGSYGAHVIELNNCGHIIQNGSATDAFTQRECKYRDYWPETGEPRPSRALVSHAQFSLDGKSLYIEMTTQRTVTITEKRTVPGISYLALGDSYSSGEGDIEVNAQNQNHYLPLTDLGVDMCHVSSRSYPFLLRDSWQIASDQMKSVACSGARLIYDYGVRADTYQGQGNRLESYDSDRRAKSQETALDKFIPGRVPQLEFVKKYQPATVTFTGGGNDVGFGEIMKYCASSVEVCGFVKGGYGTMHDDLMAQIDEQYLYTKRFIQQMQQASPATRIYAVGYPRFVYDGTTACSLNGALLSRKEREFINESVDRLNNAIARAAKDTGIYYLDITNALDGGRICEGSKYVTGLTDALKVNKMMNDANMFHPNAQGHAKIAALLAKGRLQVDSGQPASIPDLNPINPQSKLQYQALTTDVVNKNSAMTATTQSGVFASGSNVTVRLFSNEVTLGSTRATADGAATWSGDVPDSVGAGYHLLVMTGVNSEGESVKVQQFVTVRDGDVSADVSICEAIDQWYDETTGKPLCPVKHVSGESTSANKPAQQTSDGEFPQAGITLRPTVQAAATIAGPLVANNTSLKTAAVLNSGAREETGTTTSPNRQPAALYNIIVVLVTAGMLGLGYAIHKKAHKTSR